MRVFMVQKMFPAGAAYAKFRGNGTIQWKLELDNTLSFWRTPEKAQAYIDRDWSHIADEIRIVPIKLPDRN